MVEKLLVRLLGDGSSFRNMMKTAAAQTKRFDMSVANVSNRMKSLGSSARGIGTSLTVGLTLPLVAAGAASVNAFSKFDQAMVESTSIMKVTTEQTERMRQTALSLSGETQGPAEMAQSYFFLASAGLSAEQAIAALPQVSKFATAGAFDMALATDLLTDAQSALGLTSKDAAENLAGMARVSDVLVKANTLANASVQQFSEALTNTAGATLKNFNKTVEEGVAVLAAYADQGVKANVAGSNLTRITLLLQQAAQKNADAHRDLGFSVFDAQGKMRSYADIVENLETITAGMSDETKAATLAQLGFAARVQNAILPLIGSSEAIRRYQSDLESAGGTTNRVANNQMKSFSNQMKVLKNQLSALAIEMGEIFIPALLKVTAILRKGISWFRGLNDTTKTTIVVIAGMAAALGPALIAFGTLVSSVGSLLTFFTALGPIITTVGTTILAFTNPVTAVIAIIIGAVAAIRLFAGSWQAAGDMVGNAMDAIVDYVIFGFRTMNRITVAFIGWMAGRFKDLWEVDWIDAIISGIRMAAMRIQQFGNWAIRKLRSVFTGEEAGSMEDFLKTISSDLQRGASQTNFLKTIQDIAGEEFKLLQGRRETREFGAQGREPVQVSIKDSKEESAKDIKDISSGIKQTVELLQEQLRQPGVELAPLG